MQPGLMEMLVVVRHQELNEAFHGHRHGRPVRGRMRNRIQPSVLGFGGRVRPLGEPGEGV